MDELTLRPPNVECWGRGNEIGDLLSPIFSRKRSFTLVFGDSGIGKTTLFQELYRRSAGEGVFRGLHEFKRGTRSDPLLLCLDSLLKNHVLRLENWEELLLQGLHRAKASLLDPFRLQQTLSGISEIVTEAPGVGALAKVLTGSLKTFANLTSPDLGIPKEMVRRIPAEVFTDIFRILLSSFPEDQLVLMIDNLSADSESLSQQPGLARGTDALLSFLQTDFSAAERIHFLVSWKHTGRTRAAFEELSSTVIEYGGRSYPLGGISEDLISRWLEHDFDWFRAAKSKEKKKALRIAGGLPQVVAEWKDQEISALDLRQLQVAANDVISSRYASLGTELRSANDREFLFQLAIMPSILPVVSLSVLTGRDLDAINHALDDWTHRRLLRRRRVGTGPAEPIHWEFDHEKKQEVARSVLENALHDRGKRAARHLLDFFLSHVGINCEEHPEAREYLVYAEDIAHWVQPAEEEKTFVPKALICQAQSDNWRSNLPPVSASLRAPWNTRFLLYHSAIGGLPETKDLVSALEPGVLRDLRRANRSPRNVATGLNWAIDGYADAGQLARIRSMLQLLREFCRNQDDHEVKRLFARALYKCIALFGKAEQLGKVRSLLNELRALCADATPDQRIVQALRIALALGITYGGKRQIADARFLLGELRDLCQDSLRNEDMAIWLAMGLVNMMSRCRDAGHSEQAGRHLDEIRRLQTRWSEGVGVAGQLACGLIVATEYPCEDFRSLQPLVSEAVDLKTKFPTEPDIAMLCATAMAQGMSSYYENNHHVEANDLLLDLRQLQRQFPEEPNIKKAHLNGVALAAYHSANLGQLAEPSTLLGELRELLVDLPKDAQVAEASGTILQSVVMAYANSGRLSEVEGPLGELRQLQSEWSEGVRVSASLGRALSIVAASYAKTERFGNLRGIIDELLHLNRSYPENTTIRRDLVKSLRNFTAVRAAGHIDELDQLLEKLEHVCRSAPDDAQIAEDAARARFNALNHYGDAREYARMRRQLSQLRAMRRDWPKHSAIAEHTAKALANCAMFYGVAKRKNPLKPLLQEARDLHRKLPDNPIVATALAMSLSNVCQGPIEMSPFLAQ